MKKLLIYILIFCFAASVLVGCAAKVDPRADGVLTIVTTSYAGYDFARQLTKNAPEGAVELILLGKSGQDMHSFEPTAADITAIAHADVLLCVGNETWLDGAIRSSMNRTLVRVDMMAVSETVEHEHDHEHKDDEPNGADEHVWLSTENAEHIVAALGEAMIGVDEENSLLWQENLTSYAAELAVLTADYAAMREGAVRDTILIADRYPFAYLVHQLDLTCYAAFPGCSSETSASFETQMFLIEKAKTLALPYIFIIDGSDGKVARVVASESGAEILTLDSIQVVTDREKTYVGIMRKNLEQLQKALY